MSTRSETDGELRARLEYIGARIGASSGASLDRIAEEHGLKRRAVPLERATTAPITRDSWYR